MFSDELEKISWEETTKAIYSKTEADVLRAPVYACTTYIWPTNAFVEL